MHSLATSKQIGATLPVLIQSGANAEVAAHQVNANSGIIGMWSQPGNPKYNHAFARALAAIEAGVALYGAVDTRDAAEAASSGLLDDAIAASRDPRIRADVQRNNRRDALEVGGFLGGHGTVAVQVNNLMSRDPWPQEQQGPTPKPQEQGPAPKSPKPPQEAKE